MKFLILKSGRLYYWRLMKGESILATGEMRKGKREVREDIKLVKTSEDVAVIVVKS